MLLPAVVALALQEKPRFADEIRAFEAADRKRPPKPGAVLFVGSSSIRLWTTLERDFPRYRVLNRGFGGSRLDEVVANTDRIVLPYRPSAIVLYAGTNDLAEGHTSTRVAEDWAAFVGRVRARLPKVPIATIAISPAPSRAAMFMRMTDANSRIRALCERGKGLAFVDVVPAMLDGDGGPRPDLFGPDQLHMNAKGYAIWTEAVNAALAKMVRPNRR